MIRDTKLTENLANSVSELHVNTRYPSTPLFQQDQQVLFLHLQGLEIYHEKLNPVVCMGDNSFQQVIKKKQAERHTGISDISSLISWTRLVLQNISLRKSSRILFVISSDCFPLYTK